MARKREQDQTENGGVAVTEGETQTNGESSNGETETQGEEQKGYAEYKLAGDIPSALTGKLIRTPEKYTVEDFRALVQDGDEKHIVALAQAQFDIIIQRHIRNAANSEDVSKLLAAGDTDGAVARIQEVADKYVYGARPVSTGGSAVAKKAVANQKKLAAAVAADPELAQRLAALGVEL